jgi:hypothetical protein
VARSPENLARAHADTTLRNLRLAGLIEKISTENPNRVSPTMVRTERGGDKSGGKYLLQLGWADANKDLEPVFAAAKVRASLNQAGTGENTAPVVIRRAIAGETEVVLATVAVPSSTNTEVGEPGGLQPAGVNTTFLSKAWRWGGGEWMPLTIEGKPSISGPDLAILALHGPPKNGDAQSNLGPDQVALRIYRGMRQRTEYVHSGWYGMREQTVSAPRVDVVVYHLGPTSLDLVKTTNVEGIEIDAEGNPLMGEEGLYEGD